MSSQDQQVDPQAVRDLWAKVNQLEDENEAIRTRLAELEMQLQTEVSEP